MPMPPRKSRLSTSHPSCTALCGSRTRRVLLYAPLFSFCQTSRCPFYTFPFYFSIVSPRQRALAWAVSQLQCLASPCGGLSSLLPASPYAPGSNALGLAAVAFSAPPAGSAPAVPSAMESTAPTSGSVPLVRACQRPRVQLASHPCIIHTAQAEPSHKSRPHTHTPTLSCTFAFLRDHRPISDIRQPPNFVQWPPLRWRLGPTLTMSWQRLWPARYLIMCPGPQCVVHCGSSTLCLATEPDADGSLARTVPAAGGVPSHLHHRMHQLLRTRLALPRHSQPRWQVQEGHGPRGAQMRSPACPVLTTLPPSS